jgi:hypothetical protein
LQVLAEEIQMGEVVELRPREEDQPQHGDGDGGGPIVIRVVLEQPEVAPPEPKQSGSFWFGVIGFLLGFWLGG